MQEIFCLADEQLGREERRSSMELLILTCERKCHYC